MTDRFFLTEPEFFSCDEDKISYENDTRSRSIFLRKISPNWTDLSLRSSRGYIDWQPFLEQACALLGLKTDQCKLGDLGTQNPFWRNYIVPGDVDWEKFNKLTAPGRQRAHDKRLLELLDQFTNEQLIRALALRTLGVR